MTPHRNPAQSGLFPKSARQLPTQITNNISGVTAVVNRTVPASEDAVLSCTVEGASQIAGGTNILNSCSSAKLLPHVYFKTSNVVEY